MATVVKRGKSWRAMVRRPALGINMSRNFSTKAEAKAWAAAVEGDIRSRAVAARGMLAPGRMTFKDLVEDYADAVDPIQPFGRTKRQCLRTLRDELGKVKLAEFDFHALLGFVQKKVDEGRKGSTLGAYLAYTGSVLRWARAVKRLDVSLAPVAEVREALKHQGISTKSRQRDRRVRPAELKKLCAHWRANPRQSIPMADITEFAVASGLRLGEICAIRWEHLDEIDRKVKVRRKDPRDRERVEWVPLLEEAWAVIKRQPRPTATGRIFPFDSRSVSRAFARGCEAVGIEGLRFHDTRHERASSLADEGWNPVQIQRLTGHRDIRMLQRYTHLEKLPRQ